MFKISSSLLQQQLRRNVLTAPLLKQQQVMIVPSITAVRHFAIHIEDKYPKNPIERIFGNSTANAAQKTAEKRFKAMEKYKLHESDTGSTIVQSKQSTPFIS